MYVVTALLALGAVCVAFFFALFAGGALIGLGSLGMQALRAVGKTRHVKAAVTVPKAALRHGVPPEASRANTFVDPSGAYAAA